MIMIDAIRIVWTNHQPRQQCRGAFMDRKLVKCPTTVETEFRGGTLRPVSSTIQSAATQKKLTKRIVEVSNSLAAAQMAAPAYDQ
ncbi:hypothetical protein E2542_SST22596 [Spatholobus suberectus]|nr:hypothetical protein E2542_SST22596 [Spatholobus suberectus]